MRIQKYVQGKKCGLYNAWVDGRKVVQFLAGPVVRLTKLVSGGSFAGSCPGHWPW